MQPEPLVDLLRTRDALYSSLDRWEFYLEIATVLVVVGLVIEYWHEVKKVLTQKPFFHRETLKRSLGVIGGVLVTLGVMGELIVGVKTSTEQARLRETSNSIIANYNAEAAASRKAAETARREAGIANRAAEEARVNAAEANARASQYAAEIAKANAESARATERAKNVELTARQYEAKIALSNQSAAEAQREAARARLQVAEMRTPRTLSSQQREVIRSAMKRFSGTPYDLYVSTDAESTALLNVIDQILTDAGWTFSKVRSGILYANKAAPIAYSGMTIQLAFSKLADFGEAAQALGDALTMAKLPTNVVAFKNSTSMDSDHIHILVGAKPAPPED